MRARAVGQGEPNAPDAKTQADYRQIVADAVAEYEAGNIAEARAFFLRAHELWPSAPAPIERWA
jgi:hypothetical protein